MNRQISIELPQTGGSENQDDTHAIQLDVKSLLALVMRRIWLISLTTAVVFSFMAYQTFTETPTYRATAAVIVDPRELNVIELGEVLGAASMSGAVMDTEVKIISSNTLLSRVAEEENLIEDPEFNWRLRPVEPSMIDQFIGGIRATILPAPEAAPVRAQPSPEQVRERQLKSAVGALQRKVWVSRVGQTYVIDISVNSESPQTAARLANAVAEQYRVEQLEARLDATRTATEWLAARVDVLREEVAFKEREVERFRSQSGLLAAQGSTLTESSIQALQQQRIQLQADLERVQARFTNVRRSLDSGAGLDSITEVLDSPIITSLKNQRSEILSRIAKLEATLLPRHPDLVSAKGQADDIEAQINAEVDRISNSLAAEVRVARDQINEIDARIASSRNELIRNNSALVRLRELERDAEASREIYAEFVSRLKETREQNDLVQPDARILAYAGVPGRPASPRTGLNLIIGLLLGGVLGGAAALLAEIFDGKVTTTEDIEKRLGIPALGTVPLIKSMPLINRKDREPAKYVVSNPLSSFAESIRYLRAAIAFSDIDGRTQVVALTSSLPDEGKTSLSVSMARMSAMSGTKTLVIDGDFRRRQLTETMGLDPEIGFIEYLFGQGDLDAAICRDEESDLDILPLSLTGHAPHDVFGTQAFDRLLDVLRESYELILIDTGPLLLMAEARVVASKADKTILVVRWRHSNRQTVRRAIKILKDFNAGLLGAALNMVDTSNRRYSMNETSSYKAYSTYYQREQKLSWRSFFPFLKPKSSRLPTVPDRSRTEEPGEEVKDEAAERVDLAS